jgi:hypothetical protein
MKRLILFAALLAATFAVSAPAETAHNLLMQNNRTTAPYDLSCIPELYRANVNVFFVNSNATNAYDQADGIHGETWDMPFATIDFAVGRCTASQGDVIIVAPYHAETEASAAALVTCDIAGINIIGLGTGAARPTITLSTNTGAIAFTITAANVQLRNFLIVNTKDAVVKAINVAAVADTTLKDIEIRDNASTTECAIGVLTTNTGSRLMVDGFFYNGFTGGDACTQAISLVGQSQPVIKNSRFRGNFSLAAVNMAGTLSTGVRVSNCWFECGTTALTYNVVDTITGSYWNALDCFDNVGGYPFAGGKNAAVASYAPSSTSTANFDTTAVSATPSANTLGRYIYSGGTARGQPLPASMSWIDLIGNFTGPYNSASAGTNIKANQDLMKAETDMLAGAAATAAPTAGSFGRFIYSGGTARGTELADSKSLVDAIGANGSTSLADLCRVTCVQKAVATLTSGDTSLFTISGGPVRITSVLGYITTAVGATGTNCKLHITPTGGTDTDIDAAVAIQSAGQYGLLSITGTFANAMVLTATAGIVAGDQAAAIRSTPGVIYMNLSGTPGSGAITWYISYIPLATGAKIAPN